MKLNARPLPVRADPRPLSPNRKPAVAAGELALRKISRSRRRSMEITRVKPNTRLHRLISIDGALRRCPIFALLLGLSIRGQAQNLDATRRLGKRGVCLQSPQTATSREILAHGTTMFKWLYRASAYCAGGFDEGVIGSFFRPGRHLPAAKNYREIMRRASHNAVARYRYSVNGNAFRQASRAGPGPRRGSRPRRSRPHPQ